MKHLVAGLQSVVSPVEKKKGIPSTNKNAASWWLRLQYY